MVIAFFQQYCRMTNMINNSLPSYSELPAAFAINLDNLAAITLSGEEQVKYLQGQVTCDVDNLAEKKLLNGAHCNAKGKVFSAFRLLEHQSKFLLLQPKSSIAQSLAELKKFGVFAKVEINQDSDNAYLAVAGEQAATKLAEVFQQIPDSLTPVVQVNNTTLVYLAGNISRYLIIDNPETIATISTQLNLAIYSNAVWDLLEITQGFPLLSSHYVAEYVPQMLNLQAINGISFTKGCYLGQETVARMQYLGKNKRALFALEGKDMIANIGDIIEKKLGENWRKAGDVLAVYQADNKHNYIQGVLANDIDDNTELRIKSQDATLAILALPYKLNTDID